MSRSRYQTPRADKLPEAGANPFLDETRQKYRFSLALRIPATIPFPSGYAIEQLPCPLCPYHSYNSRTPLQKLCLLSDKNVLFAYSKYPQPGGMRQKAAYLYGPRDFQIIDIPKEPAGPDEVRIAVPFSAVCGSDLHLYTHGPNDYASTGKPVPTGHEYSGRVIEIGSGVNSVQAGDRVTSIPGGPCNGCLICRTGRQSMCPNRASGWTGAWAESLVVPTEIVYKLQDDVSGHSGSLAEPLACAIRAAIEVAFARRIEFASLKGVRWV